MRARDFGGPDARKGRWISRMRARYMPDACNSFNLLTVRSRYMRREDCGWAIARRDQYHLVVHGWCAAVPRVPLHTEKKSFLAQRSPPVPTPEAASGVGARCWLEQSRVRALGRMSGAPFCRLGVPVWSTRVMCDATGDWDTSPQQHDISS